MTMKWTRWVNWVVMAVVLAAGAGTPAQAAGPRLPAIGSTVMLPYTARYLECPDTSTNTYLPFPVWQWDTDDPVRKAWEFADKNLPYQGYTTGATSDTRKYLINLGNDEAAHGNPANSAPQLSELFNPDRIPAFTTLYQVYSWNYTPSSVGPGSRGDATTNPAVTVLGVQTTPGEVLQVPDAHNYSLGGTPEMEVIVLFASAHSVTFKYTDEDSVMPNGYTLRLDNICTDPNLLSAYNALDNNTRYTYCGGNRLCQYNLVGLAKGQTFGTARGAEMVFNIVDSGTSQDPRSCQEWWTNYASFGAQCN